MGNSQYYLQVEGLTKCFGQFCAVSNLSFTLEPGEILGLIGPNGSGKTTMLKCIAGLLSPNSGEIFAYGNSILDESVARDAMAFLFEVEALPNDMTVHSFLLSQAFLYGKGVKVVERVISEVSVEQYRYKRIGALSMGNKRKIGMAAALIPDSDILVLDEPTNGLDQGGLRLVRSIVEQRKNVGQATLFSSHTMSEVERLANKVLVLSEGELSFWGTLDELKAAYSVTNLEDAYEQILWRER